MHAEQHKNDACCLLVVSDLCLMAHVVVIVLLKSAYAEARPQLCCKRCDPDTLRIEQQTRHQQKEEVQNMETQTELT